MSEAKTGLECPPLPGGCGGCQSYRNAAGLVRTLVGDMQSVLVLDGDHAGTPPVDRVFDRTNPDNFERVVVFPPAGSVVIGTAAVADLRAAAGEPFVPARVVEECDACDGTGETECYACGHEEECVACDGSGKVSGETPFPVRVVEVCGVRLDANRVAALLALVPTEPGGVTVYRNAGGGAVRLVGSGWVLAIMAVSEGGAS